MNSNSYSITMFFIPSNTIPNVIYIQCTKRTFSTTILRSIMDLTLYLKPWSNIIFKIAYVQ